MDDQELRHSISESAVCYGILHSHQNISLGKVYLHLTLQIEPSPSPKPTHLRLLTSHHEPKSKQSFTLPYPGAPPSTHPPLNSSSMTFAQRKHNTSYQHATIPPQPTVPPYPAFPFPSPSHLLKHTSHRSTTTTTTTTNYHTPQQSHPVLPFFLSIRNPPTLPYPSQHCLKPHSCPADYAVALTFVGLLPHHHEVEIWLVIVMWR